MTTAFHDTSLIQRHIKQVYEASFDKSRIASYTYYIF